jgi:hypothetical protein
LGLSLINHPAIGDPPWSHLCTAAERPQSGRRADGADGLNFTRSFQRILLRSCSPSCSIFQRGKSNGFSTGIFK